MGQSDLVEHKELEANPWGTQSPETQNETKDVVLLIVAVVVIIALGLLGIGVY